jgi:hypothetical protein
MASMVLKNYVRLMGPLLSSRRFINTYNMEDEDSEAYKVLCHVT